MLRRKMLDRLMEWKARPGHKSLLLTGARQTGKTFIVDEFGKTYENYVRINFLENDSYARIFEGDRSVDSLVSRIALTVRGAKMVPGKTLLFLDEIQECPDARTALKFFTIDGRFDVIASGSMLGVKYAEVRSNPVGYIDRLSMFPLDFEEFLWAEGVPEEIIFEVRGCLRMRKPIDGLIFDRLQELFRWYTVVGGMPEVVSEFVKSRDMEGVIRLQRAIVADYTDDISKYATGKDRIYAKEALRSIPAQLSKRNKKFMYVDIGGSGAPRASTYISSISWLQDAGIAYLCNNVSAPSLPFDPDLDCFKMYMLDTGLLVSIMGDHVSKAILDDGLFVNEGAIAENVVADMLACQEVRLLYYEKKGALEIDFMLDLEGCAVAVEVKSGNSRRSRSLAAVMSERYGVARGLKLRNGNVESKDGVDYLPIFAASFLDELGGSPPLRPCSARTGP
jgi:predicted AAA+ superfamily ATPase